jgi:hypothetical protein
VEGYGVGFGDVIGHLGHFPLCRLEKGMADNESSLWGHNDGVILEQRAVVVVVKVRTANSAKCGNGTTLFFARHIRHIRLRLVR